MEPGLYVQFESQPCVRLNLSFVEASREGIELVAFHQRHTGEAGDQWIECATVFVPEGKVKYFVSRFEAYSKTSPKKKGERRYEDKIDRVASLRLATLRALFTDAIEAYPADHEAIWWEVWLRRHDGNELARVMEFASAMGIDVGARRLQFDDRIVILVHATATQLSASIDVLNDFAEVRRAKESAVDFVHMSSDEQADWASELLSRTTLAGVDAPVVCVLDTGVTRGHPLIEGSLASADCHSCEPEWGTHDHHSHGTEMAGLALYGDLTQALAGSWPVELRHRLESVKILPPRGQNAPELYGAVTAEATSRVEIRAPERRRCFSISIGADKCERGQPTSWSAAIDALAAGRAFDSHEKGLVYLDDGDAPTSRLFVLSAGNVDEGDLIPAHLDLSDTVPVDDPAQAWNAITVGAFTEKALVEASQSKGWAPVAPAGELSPFSATGVSFAAPWPIKPEVVFEGGNVAKNPAGDIDSRRPELCLLSTHFRPTEKLFALSWATSAAAPQAARMAAMITAEYPALWPETVRALIVHSAEWTSIMKAHFDGTNAKRGRERLVRRYGYGVPNLERALRSANDAVTLIAQSTIRPFADGKMREMQLFELPWPQAALRDLGEVLVRLRVTLSYFVEPNPGRRGWRKRHSYASHGLRFELKAAGETVETFRKRLNQLALDEDEARPRVAGESTGWFLGGQARNRGSVHSDTIELKASDLAKRGVIGVHPVTGWWKEQPKRDRSNKGARYALVVSIESPMREVDLWTPIAEQVGIPVVV